MLHVWKEEKEKLKNCDERFWTTIYFVNSSNTLPYFLILLQVNNGVTYVEAGCLRHPGASTIGSQLQDRDCTVHWWLPKTDNPAMSPHAPEKTGTCHTDTQWKAEGGDEREQKPLRAPHIMLLLPATLINTCYHPKHD